MYFVKLKFELNHKERKTVWIFLFRVLHLIFPHCFKNGKWNFSRWGKIRFNAFLKQLWCIPSNFFVYMSVRFFIINAPFSMIRLSVFFFILYRCIWVKSSKANAQSSAYLIIVIILIKNTCWPIQEKNAQSNKSLCYINLSCLLFFFLSFSSNIDQKVSVNWEFLFSKRVRNPSLGLSEKSLKISRVFFYYSIVWLIFILLLNSQQVVSQGCRLI